MLVQGDDIDHENMVNMIKRRASENAQMHEAGVQCDSPCVGQGSGRLDLSQEWINPKLNYDQYAFQGLEVGGLVMFKAIGPGIETAIHGDTAIHGAIVQHLDIPAS